MDNIVIDRDFNFNAILHVDNLNGVAMTDEAGAHTFRIHGKSGNTPTAITGTITGQLMNANKVMVPLDGSLTEGVAEVTLTDECYDVPGQYLLTIWAMNGGVRQCIYGGVGTMMRSSTSTVMYPTADLPDLADLMADLQEILDGWPADYSQLQTDVSNLKTAFTNDQIKRAVIKTSQTAKVIAIDDAITDIAPVSIANGLTVYGRNIGQANAIDRTDRTVDFSVSVSDPNTIYVNGTATGGNAYSDTSITSTNAKITVPAGTYYLYGYCPLSGSPTGLMLYVNNVTAGTTDVTKVNTLKTYTFEAQTQLSVRIQVVQSYAFDTSVSVYFSPIAPDEYYPYEVPNGKMHSRTVVIGDVAGNIKYYAYNDMLKYSAIVKTVTGTNVEINDAIPGYNPVTMPNGAEIVNRNMYKANIQTRDSGGVTFTACTTDPNTVSINGTGTGDGYSDTTITSANAGALVEPGSYYIARYFDDDRGRLPLVSSNMLYIIYDIIDYASGTKTNVVLDNVGVSKITVSAKSYLAVRVKTVSGVTYNNVNVHLYISKFLPLPDYVPYCTHDGLMHKQSVIIGTGTTQYYAYNAAVVPRTLSITTFNVGGYTHGQYSDDSITDFALYANYIGKTSSELLCTQEDRILYDVSENITTMSKLYNYMYENGGISSNSTSSADGKFAKGIYGNVGLSPLGKYTFATQGTIEEGGSALSWSSLSYCTTVINGKTALIISAHLASGEWNESARESEVSEIIAFAGASGAEYIIICGDFNNWNDELTGFKTAGYVMGNCDVFGTIYTYYVGDHPFDNIIVSPNLKIRNVEAVSNELHDHYALKAVINA